MHWWVKIQVFRNKIPNFLCFSFIFSSFTTIKKKFYGKWEAAGARVTVWITAGRIPGTPTHQAAVPARGLLCSLKKKEKKNQDKTVFQAFSQKTDTVPECTVMGVISPSPPLLENSGSRKKQRAMGTTLSLVILMGFAALMKFICSLILSNHIATNEADPTQGAVTVRSSWAWVSEAKVNFSRQFQRTQQSFCCFPGRQENQSSCFQLAPLAPGAEWKLDQQTTRWKFR